MTSKKTIRRSFVRDMKETSGVYRVPDKAARVSVSSPSERKRAPKRRREARRAYIRSSQ